MKKKYFFAIAALSLLFVACGKDDITGDDNGVVTDPTGDAWVSLQVVTPQKAFTRGLNSPDQETGTATETTVNSVRAIFFGAPTTVGDDNTAVVTADMTLGIGGTAGNPNQPEGDAGKAFKVPATSKRILIIANPHANLPTTAVGTTTYATFNAALTIASSELSGAAGTFMMTNAKGGLEPSTSTGAAADLVLYNTASNAENNPLHIAIDRVVSKVRVYWGAATIVGGTLSSGGWVLNATNKKFFPVSKRTLTWNENPANTGARGRCITPFDQYKIGSYRIDPNYDTQPGAPDASDSWTAYNAEYNYYFNSAASIPWKTTSGSAEYCHENTQTAAHNVWAYTTQVLFKGVFSPTGLLAPDGTTYTEADVVTGGDLAAGQDFMMVNGGYYTWELLMLYMTKELQYKYSNDDVSAGKINNPTLTNALNNYLKGVGIIGTLIPIPAKSGDNFAAQAAAVVDAFKTHKAAVATAGANRVGAVTYYEGGLSYWPIMIRHDDTDAASNELGEFGVVRNSVYDVNITRITTPGYPKIPDPDPKTPDEEDENYISVKIDVNPWTWYTQIVEL